jgi:hypothetical protein
MHTRGYIGTFNESHANVYFLKHLFKTSLLCDTTAQYYYTAAATLRMETHSLVVASARLCVLHSRIPPVATVAHRDAPEIVAGTSSLLTISGIPLAANVHERVLALLGLRLALLLRRRWLRRGRLVSRWRLDHFGLRPGSNESTPVSGKLVWSQETRAVPPMAGIFTNHKI